MKVHVCRTHPWWHANLTVSQDAGDLDVLGPERALEAEVVVYPVPSLPTRAPDQLTRLDPRLWSRLFVVTSEDLPVMWAPGVYTSPPPGQSPASVRGGIYVSALHAPDAMRLEPSPVAAAEHLWSFVGVVANHPATRRPLLDLADPRALVRDNREWKRVDAGDWRGAEAELARRGMADFEASIRASKFVVCPRGVGSSSKRLFEAMAMGRCPVIVSDDWLPPAFIDWASCSIRVPQRRIAELPEILRAAEPRAAELGYEARRAWERWLSPERRLAYVVRAALDIEAAGGATPAARADMLARCVVARPFARSVKARTSWALQRALAAGRGGAQ